MQSGNLPGLNKPPSRLLFDWAGLNDYAATCRMLDDRFALARDLVRPPCQGLEASEAKTPRDGLSTAPGRG